MRRTRNGLPKWCSWNRDRADGKRRVLFRRTGRKPVYLPGLPYSEEFMAAYAKLAHAGSSPSPSLVAATAIRDGSIDALIESYYKLVFPTVGKVTRTTRRGILERFRKEHGHRLVAHLEERPEASLPAGSQPCA